MLELEDALARVLAAVPSPAGETVPLIDAAGRVLLETVVSPSPLPLFDNSAMDGYAVCATDTAGATAGSPRRLRVIGRVAAGEIFHGTVVRGTCVRAFTGSALPRGADAVVMQEDTQLDPTDSSQVLVLEGVGPGENIRCAGEEVRTGETLLPAGTLLNGPRVALLGAAGVAKVSVGKRPVVGLLATGSELCEPGQPLEPGQIYESNRLGLFNWVRLSGAVPLICPLVKDTLAGTRLALEQAFAQADGVVTSGGVSVGETDYVRAAFEEAGGELQFWKVAIKPGRPFVFGRRGQKLLFGLPGNPVSALVTFLLLVRPTLLRWQGAVDVAPPACPGVVAEELANDGERPHFMRVIMDPNGKVRSAGLQASHALRTLASANGLVRVAPHTTLAPGTVVQVILAG